MVVDSRDPANADLVAEYVPTPRREGQSVRVISRDMLTTTKPNKNSDDGGGSGHARASRNLDILLWPLLPSFPGFAQELYILGLGMIRWVGGCGSVGLRRVCPPPPFQR